MIKHKIISFQSGQPAQATAFFDTVRKNMADYRVVLTDFDSRLTTQGSATSEASIAIEAIRLQVTNVEQRLKEVAAEQKEAEARRVAMQNELKSQMESMRQEFEKKLSAQAAELQTKVDQLETKNVQLSDAISSRLEPSWASPWMSTPLEKVKGGIIHFHPFQRVEFVHGIGKIPTLMMLQGRTNDGKVHVFNSNGKISNNTMPYSFYVTEKIVGFEGEPYFATMNERSGFIRQFVHKGNVQDSPHGLKEFRILLWT